MCAKAAQTKIIYTYSIDVFQCTLDKFFNPLVPGAHYIVSVKYMYVLMTKNVTVDELADFDHLAPRNNGLAEKSTWVGAAKIKT